MISTLTPANGLKAVSLITPQIRATTFWTGVGTVGATGEFPLGE
jgi:hypothetical protein